MQVELRTGPDKPPGKPETWIPQVSFTAFTALQALPLTSSPPLSPPLPASSSSSSSLLSLPLHRPPAPPPRTAPHSLSQSPGVGALPLLGVQPRCLALLCAQVPGPIPPPRLPALGCHAPRPSRPSGTHLTVHYRFTSVLSASPSLLSCRLHAAPQSLEERPKEGPNQCTLAEILVGGVSVPCNCHFPHLLRLDLQALTYKHTVGER